MDVLVERVIALPPERVAGYAMDWRHDAEWINGIHSVELSAEADGGGFGAGAEITRTAYILGRRIDYVFQVVEYAPPCRLGLRAVAGPFPMDSAYRFDAHADGTLASIRVRGDASRYLRIGIPVLRAVVRSSLRRSLCALARNLGQSAS
ncbi:MAG TPA: SRPBCC family protein [Pseudonocardiaceae bacterium]|nr:SRPBCC family protein [Pseudonocardiaceae bacterium]